MQYERPSAGALKKDPANCPARSNAFGTSERLSESQCPLCDPAPIADVQELQQAGAFAGVELRFRDDFACAGQPRQPMR